jgi:hypothetical protein
MTTKQGITLCIKCRSSGHIFSQCPYLDFDSEQFHWFLSEARQQIYSTGSSESSQELCQRCQNLNILELLDRDLPWKTTGNLNQLARDGTSAFRSIGKTGTIQFWHNCQLCVCLFALTPTPSSLSQEVFILTDWSMNRVAGETDTVTDTEGWDQFAKCLLVTLGDKDGFGKMEFSTKIHRGDAMCVLEEHNVNSFLGGRVIDSHEVNIPMITQWLTVCDKLHISKCQPIWNWPLPHLKLLDVNSRKIVKAPTGSFDYLALSYVWGGIEQRSYQLNSQVEEVPKTIQDAISLTRQLGKRYIWIDSLCIDQSDSTDKEQQINTMQDIYGGAYLTIVALSGSSANSGLPRVSQTGSSFSQLSCSINGKKLVSLMPTLSQQIWRAPWGQRAWTLQEALLSPRCVYVSDHQLYFECNGMQACESLNDMKSWAHNLPLQSNLPSQGGWLASKVGDGCLRVPIDNVSRRMDRYGSKLVLYSYRSMSHDADSLNAFSGILQYLGTMYPKGFYVGIPIEELNWGLLWWSQYPPKRRQGFPTWSWAGWKGGLWSAFPHDISKPNEHSLHIRIWRADKSNLMLLFSSSHVDEFGNDPVKKATLRDIQGPAFNLINYPSAVGGKYLFLEAITFDFAPDYNTLLEKGEQYSIFIFRLRGVICYIRIISRDAELSGKKQPVIQRFILLARDFSRQNLVYHHLLLIHYREGIAERRTVLQLIVPVDKLDVLESCLPNKRRIVLR